MSSIRSNGYSLRGVLGSLIWFGLASFAVALPIVACGDDDANVREEPSRPADGGPVDAGGSVDVATPPVPDPIGPISFTLVKPVLPESPDAGEDMDAGPTFDLAALEGYLQPVVIFYPKASPDRPIVEPISFGQTVTKELSGAHILFAWKMPSEGVEGASVLELDDVTPNERIEYDWTAGSGAGFQPPRSVPLLRKATALDAGDDAGDLTYTFLDCNSAQQVTPLRENDDPQLAAVDSTCVDGQGMARFAVTVRSSTRGPIAIGTTTVDVGGGLPLADIREYSTPAPTTWAVNGVAPEGTFLLEVRAYATMGDDTRGLMIGAGSLLGPDPKLSFIRPAAGFSDHEVRTVSAAMTVPDKSLSNLVTVTERSAVDAPVSTDLGGLVRFTTAAVATTAGGTPRIDFSSSSAFPTDTLLYTRVNGTNALRRAVSWFTVSPRAGQGHLEGLVLPDSVRGTYVGSVATWQLKSMRAVSGLDPRELRARNLNEVAFGQYKLPSGNIRVTETLAAPPSP